MGKDCEIARVAVRQDIAAFIWAHSCLRDDKETVFAALQHLEEDLRRKHPRMNAERIRRTRQKCRQHVREMWFFIDTCLTQNPMFLNEVARTFPGVAKIERRTRLYGLEGRACKVERQRVAQERQSRRR